MTNYIDRFDVLRFPLIVLVVYIHSAVNEVNYADQTKVVSEASTLFFIQDLISDGICRVAVPLFCFISGYLFFSTIWSLDTYQKKLLSRLQTLAVPYLFWNVTVFCVVVAGQMIPATKPFFSNNHPPISTMKVPDVLNSVFGLTGLPIAYQFWFIRDLMVLVFLSPVIYALARTTSFVGLAALFALWVFDFWPIYVPAAEPTLFFYLGALVAIAGISPFVVDCLGPQCLVAYVVLLGLTVMTRGETLGQPIHHVTVAFGCASVLYLSKILAEKPQLNSILVYLGSASFFVFATHEPLLTICRKLSYRILTVSAEVALALYILIPVFVILVGLAAHAALIRIAPSLTKFVTGGR